MIDKAGDIMTPEAKRRKRAYDLAFIRKLRKNPKYRAKERLANKLRMRRYAEAKRRQKRGS